MGWISKVGLTATVAIAVVAGVVVYRTLTYEAPAQVDTSQIRLAGPQPVDVNRAAANLSRSIQFLTVSNQNLADNNTGEWTRLHDWLKSTYPAAHAAMTLETADHDTLIYTWAGSDPALDPIILMAHQDVVPVTAGTETDWKHPPFSGDIAEGAVWGRGSIDDKGTLITLFEALEDLAKAGFKPRRTVILVSGGDEEVFGGGARSAAAHLAARKVKALFVLDEGMAVIANNPITGTKAALIGVSEKGYATLRVSAPSAGGHSSAPPSETGVETLSKAILAITSHPFDMKFSGPGADMLRVLAAKAPFVTRMAVANDWLFGGVLVSQAAKTPAGAAMLHTTIAPTMLEGSPKENVLPQDAHALINHRIQPGHSSAEIMAHHQTSVSGLPVKLTWESPPREPSPVSSTQSEGWKIIAALAGAESGAPVAPTLVTAGTDSRELVGVARDVYRFAPFVATMDETRMIHGTNEHMTLANLERMVRFYRRLIETAAA
jgi:carboxypeptidase PM20D1